MGDFEEILGHLTELDPSPVSLLSKGAMLIRKRRLEEAGRIIRNQMARGRPWAFRDDAVASLTFDFLRAAEDGVARDNLQLMARLIANGVAEQGLTEAEVRHLMRIVSELSYDEMRALAALIRAQQAFKMPHDLNEPPTKFWVVAQIYDLAWKDLAGTEGEEPPEWVVGTFGALMRTGLLYSDSAWEGMKYAGTPMLSKLTGLIDLGDFPIGNRRV